MIADDGFTPAIDGLLEKVAPLTDRQKQIIAQEVAAGSEVEDKEPRPQGLGQGRGSSDQLDAAGLQPTVNIQGLVSGYTGPGGKTVLPGRAEAKLDLRLVPNMTFDDTARS